MKKYLIGGVVAGVIAIIIVVTSMVTGGSDKFVGTWYKVKIKGSLFTSPYIEEMVIEKNGKDYLLTMTKHFYKLHKKWKQGETTKLIASKKGNNTLYVNVWGDEISLEYNEKDKIIVFDKAKYTKLDTSINELKNEFEPQMEEAEEKREKNLKSTDGLGCRYDNLSDLIKTNKKK